MNQTNQTIQTKSNNRGGARKNAGRKKSAVTVRTREIAERVITEANGNSPLEIMLKVMQEFVDQAEVASNSEDGDERKAAPRLMLMAAGVAKDAAPYIHPRLAAIDHTTNGKEMMQSTGVLVAPSAMSEADWEKQANG